MRLTIYACWFAGLTLAMAAGHVAAAEHAPWSLYARRPDLWYQSEEGVRVTANIRSHQSAHGDWPKNVDTSALPFSGEPATIHGTFDNGATVDELRFLARAFRATGDTRNRDAFLKGLHHILRAQYANGGWPQLSPPGKGYHRYITFNDNTTANLLRLVHDVASSDDYDFVDPKIRLAAERSFKNGIECILSCQVKINGNLTVWCAQHDETTLEPRPARTFEPVSLSGAESAELLLLLMSIEQPSPEIVRAVEAGARWFERTKLVGIREVRADGDKRVVRDPSASPLWARFYEIPSMRPIFCGRDGQVKYDLAQIEPERRNGYAWYGAWGAKVGARYRSWSATALPVDRLSPAKKG